MTFAERLRNELPGGEARLSIELSALCNLRCEMCSLAEFYSEKGWMRPEVFYRIAPHLAGMTRVDLGTTAEPLINPHLDEYVRAILECAPHCAICLVTNGTLLTPTRSDALCRMGLAEFAVSLDAASEETYRRIRGASLGQVLENLAALCARRGKSKVFINFTLQGRNIEELVPVVDLCRRYAVDRLYVNRVEPYTEEVARMAPTFQTGGRAREVIEEALDRAGAGGLEIHVAADEPLATGPCTFFFPSVAWNGEVSPCAACSYERNFYDGSQWQRYPFRSYGNVLRQSLPEIWDNPAYAALRQDVVADRDCAPCSLCLRRRGIICPTAAADRFWQRRLRQRVAP